MYRIALLQNQSEAFELSYGDVFSWFTRTFSEYQWDLYSTENSMVDLFQKMGDDYYDALVFTTNAFNDIYLRKCWADKSEDVNRFLEKRKGVLILQQLKVAGENLDMMPDNLGVKIIKRPASESRDSAYEKLFINNQHEIVRYPNTIQTDEVMDICLRNSTIEYTYWCYLIAQQPENWIELIYDDSHEETKRSLLLVSGPQTPGRMVITSMVLDWQRQYQLLKNILSYVVEGKHDLAVIRKSGKSSYDFEYLLHNLRIAKYPFREYTMKELDFGALYPQMHNIVIMDPAWSPNEVSQEQMALFRSNTKKESRLVLFDVDTYGEPALTTIGGILHFKSRYQQAINYLKFSFDRNGGRWDGSYFSTVHILNTLRSFDEPIDEYIEPFLTYIQPHDIDGSYDRQFATTCALLQVYFLFLGSQHPKFIKTLDWLRREISIERKSVPDLARAYYLFHQCKVPVSINDVKSIYQKILTEKNYSEEEIYRYISLFLAYGLIDELIPFTVQLLSSQRRDGSWGYQEKNRLFFTALLVDLLISIKDAVASKGQVIKGIDESILNGIIHLKGYDLISLPSKDKASTIAAVLKTIRHFESKINFPIDEFLQQQRVVSAEFRKDDIFDTSNQLITILQSEKVKLAKALNKTIEDLVESRQQANRIGYIILTCLPLLVISLSLLGSLAISLGLRVVFEPILSLDLNWLAAFFTLIIIMFALMARRRILPKQLKQLLKMTTNILVSPGKAFEGTEDEK